MSGPFTPTPVQQSKYTQPNDGDTKSVASVEPFLQGLADGAAATPLIPFNWRGPATTPDNVKRGWFSVEEQAWYAVGDGGTDFLDVSYNGGLTWKSLTTSLAGVGALADIAFDVGGNGVILTLTRNVYKGTFNAYGNVTWAVEATVFPVAPSDGRITHDHVHNNWIAVYRTGITGMVVMTSPDGVTWTSRALPASWTGYTGTAATPEIYTYNGTTICAFFDDVAVPTKYRVIRSTDGGATWTDEADINSVLASSSALSIAYDPVYSEWYFASSKTVPRGSELYQSANDGVTWTAAPSSALLAGAVDIALQDIVALCGQLVGINDDGRIFWSPDVGRTWWIGTTCTITSPAKPGLRVGDGQLMVWNSADKTAYASLRYGAVGLRVV